MEEAVTSSWESAVDMIAAKIPHNSRPPMKGMPSRLVKTSPIISINTFSGLLMGLPRKNARPIAPRKQAEDKEITTHAIATLRDLRTSSSFLIAIKRIRICGMPK